MWLWVASTDDAEAFRLLPGRGQDQAKDLLGEGFTGVIHRDRWKPYELFKHALHQLCHSHIRRDFQSMLESVGETGTQGCMLNLASDRALGQLVGLSPPRKRRAMARRRGIDLLDWLTKALQARLVGASAPPFRAI